MDSSSFPNFTRLLGATAYGLGTITAVDPYGVYVIVTDADGLEHHRFRGQLEHVTLSAPQRFEKITRRVGYGTWDEVHSLIPVGEHEGLVKDDERPAGWYGAGAMIFWGKLTRGERTPCSTTCTAAP